MSRNILKETLKGAFKAAGYDLVNRTLFGHDSLRDLQTLFTHTPSPVFMDIGANIGQTSLELIDTFGKSTIYAIEPDPAAFTELEKAVASFPSIHPFNIGFGNREETAIMNINKGSGGNSLLPLSENIHLVAQGDWTEKAGEREVAIVPLDTFCEKEGIAHIDLLKIDTQGYEKVIFEGGASVITPAFTSVIFIEVLFAELYEQQAYFHDIYALLTAKGYKLAGFYNPFRRTEAPYDLLWCDALFVGQVI